MDNCLYLAASNHKQMTMNSKPFFLPQAEYERLKSLYPKFNEPWQAAEIDELKAMYNDGVPIREISEQLGRTQKSIRLRLTALGLYEPKPSPKAWTEDDERRLVRMYNEDLSFKEMSDILGRSEGAVVSRLVRLRVKLFQNTPADNEVEPAPAL